MRFPAIRTRESCTLNPLIVRGLLLMYHFEQRRKLLQSAIPILSKLVQHSEFNLSMLRLLAWSLVSVT